MSDTWQHIRADAVVMEWVDFLKSQGALSLHGEIGGRDELVAIVEEALTEAIDEGKKSAVEAIARTKLGG